MRVPLPAAKPSLVPLEPARSLGPPRVGARSTPPTAKAPRRTSQPLATARERRGSRVPAGGGRSRAAIRLVGFAGLPDGLQPLGLLGLGALPGLEFKKEQSETAPESC